jgi:hypothetical protein
MSNVEVSQQIGDLSRIPYGRMIALLTRPSYPNNARSNNNSQQSI